MCHGIFPFFFLKYLYGVELKQIYAEINFKNKYIIFSISSAYFQNRISTFNGKKILL